MSTRGTVLVFGTFDLLHEGHRSFFRQAKRYGDRLIVGVARDRTVRKMKGRRPVQSERSRRARVARVPEVDHAYLGHERDYLALLCRVRPDVICLGYDQRSTMTRDLDTALRTFPTPIILRRMKPYQPHRYKSSFLRTE